MSRRSILFVLAPTLILSALMLTVGGVVAANQPVAAASEQPGGCFWMWGGPASGWLLDADSCGGKCSPPTSPGLYIGQTASTACDLTP